MSFAKFNRFFEECDLKIYDPKIDEKEVLYANWYSKSKALKMLTYENDKVLFFNLTKSLK